MNRNNIIIYYHILQPTNVSRVITFCPLDSYTRDIVNDLRCPSAYFKEVIKDEEDMTTNELFHFIMIEHKINLPIYMNIKIFRIQTIEHNEFITKYTELDESNLSLSSNKYGFNNTLLLFYQFSGPFTFSMFPKSCVTFAQHYNKYWERMRIKRTLDRFKQFKQTEINKWDKTNKTNKTNKTKMTTTTTTAKRKKSNSIHDTLKRQKILQI